MTKDAEAVLAICYFLFPPFALQSVGLFTPKWVSNDTCSSIGLLYSCCSGDDNVTCDSDVDDGLHTPALGLHLIAFTIMLMAVVANCLEHGCNKYDGGNGLCGAIGCCLVVLYPVAGLFSFIGCMLLVPSYKAPQLGYSFYLCLTAGCMVILLTILLCWLACRTTKNGNGGTGSRYGAVQHAVIEQRTFIHDPETGGMFTFIRRINITNIVGILRNGDN